MHVLGAHQPSPTSRVLIIHPRLDDGVTTQILECVETYVERRVMPDFTLHADRYSIAELGKKLLSVERPGLHSRHFYDAKLPPTSPGEENTKESEGTQHNEVRQAREPYFISVLHRATHLSYLLRLKPGG